MTRHHLADGSITTPDEFAAVLAEAVEQAVEADVDVRGAWEVRTRESDHGWELQVVELAGDGNREEE